MMQRIEQWEEEGQIFVIRPTIATVSRLEAKPEVLENFYQHGYDRTSEQLAALQSFLSET